MKSVKTIAKNSKNFYDFSQEYLKNLNVIFKKINQKSFNSVLKEFSYVRDKKLTMFVAGNGGGAATATTMANDLGFDLSEYDRSQPFGFGIMAKKGGRIVKGKKAAVRRKANRSKKK